MVVRGRNGRCAPSIGRGDHLFGIIGSQCQRVLTHTGSRHKVLDVSELSVPTYQYQCNDCGEAIEVVQKFSDDSLTVCPSCDGSLRKLYNAVGIVFKGSGFYRNDSRGTSSSSTASSSDSSNSSSSSSSGSSSGSASSAGSSTPAPTSSGSSSGSTSPSGGSSGSAA